MQDANALIDAVLANVDIPLADLPDWAIVGVELPDGRAVYYAETYADDTLTIATHQYAGRPATVLLDLAPLATPLHLTPTQAHAAATALTTAADTATTAP